MLVCSSAYSLAEARVLYELAQAGAIDVLDLRHRLGSTRPP